MSKRRKRRTPQSQAPRWPGDGKQAGAGGAGELPRTRNHALDTLRGLAILLMIVDHVAGVLLDLAINESSVRLVTRLAMPLFCVLMGYFLRPERRFQWQRPVQILAAAVVANAVFVPFYGTIEILGSLLLAYLAFVASGRYFPWLVLVIAAYPIDPLRPWFDFPPSIVISFVAQGALLRRYGIGAALAGGTWLAAGAVWIDSLEPTGVNQKLCLFLLPATLLVYLAAPVAAERITAPTKRIIGLDWLGKHPLAVYVAQYYIIFAIWLALQS